MKVDFGLEVEIELTERRLGYLLELKQRRSSSIIEHHGIVTKTSYGHIIQVTCTCGEVTNYRVALKTLDDFVCPQERNTRGKVQQVQKLNDKGSGRTRLPVKSKRKKG